MLSAVFALATAHSSGTDSSRVFTTADASLTETYEYLGYIKRAEIRIKSATSTSTINDPAGVACAGSSLTSQIVYYKNGTTLLNGGTVDPTSAQTFPALPLSTKQIYEGHNKQDFHFYLKNTKSCSSNCQCSFDTEYVYTSIPRIPETCVCDPKNFSDYAEFHPGSLFVNETTTLQSIPDYSFNSSFYSEIFYEPNKAIYDLGVSSEIQLSCLQIDVVPAAVPVPDGCTDSRIKNVGQPLSNNDFEVSLVGVASCVEGSGNPCCSKTGAYECFSDSKCFWAPSQKKCLSRTKGQAKSEILLSNRIGNEGTISFATDLVESAPLVTWDQTEPEGRLNWFLQLTNKQNATNPKTTSCTVEAFVSFTSVATSGFCYSTIKQTCNAQAEKCFLSAPSGIQNVKEHFCQCLAQKERCFRSGSCSGVEDYTQILQNCRSEECHDLCGGLGQEAL